MDKIFSYLCGSCTGQDNRTRLEEISDTTSTSGRNMESEFHGFTCTDRISCLTSLPNNLGTIIAGTSEGDIYRHDCSLKNSATPFKAHDKSVTQMRHHVDDLYVTSSRDDTVKIWNHSGSIHTLTGFHELVITTVDSNNHDRNRIVTGSRDNQVALWDVDNNKVISSNQIARNIVTDLCWKENLIAQTSEDKSLRLFDSSDLTTPVHQFACTKHILTSCDMNGDLILTSSGGFNGNGCYVTMWDRRHGTYPLNVLYGHGEKIHQVKFLSSDRAVSIGADNKVNIWNLTKRVVELCAHTLYSAHCIEPLNNTGTAFAVGTDENGVQILNRCNFMSYNESRVV